jgi:hypothetical protein
MPSCQILKLETVKGDTNTDVFNPFTDAITLRITFTVSPDLIQQSARATLIYQVLSFADNQVKFQTASTIALGAGDGEKYAWVNIGTADSIHLDSGSFLFGFRAAVTLQPAPSAADPNSPYLAFAVADPHWFRLLPVGEL